MTRTTKTLLAISLGAFAVSGTHILWGVAMPVGAISFGLFMVSKVLERVTAEYDAEQKMRIALADQHRASEPAPPASTGAPASSRLKVAHSHASN